PGGDEQTDDGNHAVPVEQLPREKPGEHPPCAEGVEPELPSQVLGQVLPSAVEEQRDHDPGDDEQTADPDGRRSPQSLRKLTRTDQDPHAEDEKDEISGQEMKRD